MQERESFILETVLRYREAIVIESLHRWYYDEYSIHGKVNTPEQETQATLYRHLTKWFPNWRAVLFQAKELLLPLPEDINLKRYSNI